MEGRKVVGVVVAVVVVTSVLGIIFVIPATSSQFHYEDHLSPSDPDGVRVVLDGLEDTNVTITFVAEPTLWYRMDITQYNSGKSHSIEAIRFDTHLYLGTYVTAGRIQDIMLVLGTGAVYAITIAGENVNATVVYDNGARLGSQTHMFTATGIFRFRLTENVNFTDHGMRIRAEPTNPDFVFLDIDLPDGLNADLKAPDATFVLNEWPMVVGNHYRTTSTDEPFLDVDIPYSPVVASLRL